jgi:hypothetical protein
LTTKKEYECNNAKIKITKDICLVATLLKTHVRITKKNDTPIKIINERNKTEARNCFLSSLKSKYPLFNPTKRLAPTKGTSIITTE